MPRSAQERPGAPGNALDCSVWSYAAVCRRMQSYAAVCGRMWPYAVVCGLMQSYAVVCSRMRSYEVVCGLILCMLQSSRVTWDMY